jgi:hypothetical protein
MLGKQYDLGKPAKSTLCCALFTSCLRSELPTSFGERIRKVLRSPEFDNGRSLFIFIKIYKYPVQVFVRFRYHIQIEHLKKNN